MTNNEIEKTIALTLKQLFEQAEVYGDGSNIDNAIGEVTIKGIEYQIQLSLIAEKRIWAKPDEVRYSSVVKVHPNESLQ